MNLIKQVVMLCVAACAMLFVPVQAQQAACTSFAYVQVMESNSNAPLVGAVVGWGKQQGMTDLDGMLKMEQLCAASLHLHVQALGYDILDADVSFKEGDTLRLHLKASNQTLDAVEITGHKQALKTTTSVTTLHQEDLDKLKGSNLANILKTIPGVNMIQTGATIAKPVINGLHSNRILILNNGIRQEGQQWGSEHAPEIDPFIAQEISVVKGAEAIRFGPEAIGGVVILEPPALPTDSSIHAEVNLVGASNGRSGTASAMLSGNFKSLPALAWRVQGTAKQSGDFKTADYFLENTGAKELNYSAALGYNKEHFGVNAFYSHFNTALGIFKGSHMGSPEDLQAAIANGKPFIYRPFSYDINVPRQQVVHDLLKLDGHVHLSDYLHFNAQYGFQRDSRKEFDIRRGGRSATPSQDINLYTQTLNAYFEYFDGKRLKATFGADGLYQNNENTPGTGVTPFIPDHVSKGLGVYAIGKYLNDNYELEAGLRYDYKTINALGYDVNGALYGNKRQFNNVTSSIGGVFHVSKELDVRTNIGTAFRPASVNELYSEGIHQSVGSYEIGDNTLSSEKSLKWITSLQYSAGSGIVSVFLDGYVNYFDGYIYQLFTNEYKSLLSGSFPIYRQRQGNARFLGADLTAKVKLSKQVDYSLKASVVRAKNTSIDKFLPMIPSDRVEQAVQFKYNPLPFLKESYVQLAYLFVAKQNRFDAASEMATPPPAYHLFNLSLGTEITSGKHALHVNFAIDNLTNTLYKDYMNRFRYYAHDLGRNYVLRLTYRI